MASLLMQERLLGFSLGAALGGGLATHLHRLYWKSTADVAHQISQGRIPPPNPVPVPEPLLLNKATREELAHKWNLSIDYTLGAVVAHLSSRGWKGDPPTLGSTLCFYNVVSSASVV
ncbi:hypothetical protein GOP47_0021593 [Adiantum capillus-veneris]|uniref:Uncharacterized protein n=1 Tax=Adiantum capillus-veneris TaxID=13818 RepID=A0A9D4U9X1_ADICA|nr:hypothetical protein GOP47_0021593 [Adiantum capillus-veneris]